MADFNVQATHLAILAHAQAAHTLVARVPIRLDDLWPCAASGTSDATQHSRHSHISAGSCEEGTVSNMTLRHPSTDRNIPDTNL